MGQQKDIQLLRKNLRKLQQNGCVVALKTGTEVEDMGFDEISFMREVSSKIMPLIVKIGGPEARNDIRSCMSLSVDGILAPMVETVYALSNFVQAVKSVCEEKGQEMPYLAMNLESITAYENLDNMLETKAFQLLNQVTIGRGDFSSSMHMKVDDDEVLSKTAIALRKISGQKKVTSCGGGLKLANIELLVSQIPSDRFNTRHIVLQNNKRFRKNATAHLFHALEFEQQMCQALAMRFDSKRDFYHNRVEVLAERMGNFQIRQSI